MDFNGVDLAVFIPIAKGYVTLREVEEHYSLCDLADLHDTIEAISEMESISAKQAQGSKK